MSKSTYEENCSFFPNYSLSDSKKKTFQKSGKKETINKTQDEKFNTLTPMYTYTTYSFNFSFE